MKKKVLLSSIATIALCLCLIAGSTFALFTSQTDFNIAVTAGKVDVKAVASISGVYSAEAADVAEDEFLVDENGYTYKHTAQENDTFANGGNAELNGSGLTINRITPGDKVDVLINVTNDSNVAISYRYKISVNTDTGLASGMVLTVDEAAYEGFESYTSAWFTADAPNGEAEEIAPKTISVELPVYADNEYQEKSVEYTILVEAVQGNGVVNDESIVTILPETLAKKFLKGGLVDGNGAEVSPEAALEASSTNDLTIANLTLNGDNVASGFENAIVYAVGYESFDIVLDNGAVINATKDKFYGLRVLMGTRDITLEEGSKINVSGDNAYGIFFMEIGGEANLTLEATGLIEVTGENSYGIVAADSATVLNIHVPSIEVMNHYKSMTYATGGATINWIIDGMNYPIRESYTEAIVGDSEGTTYEGDLFEEGMTDFLVFQNAVLSNDATITVKRTYSTVALENVVADVNGDLITAETDNTIVLHNCDITLDEGKKLIVTTEGVTVGQVMIHNVTVNGVLLTQDTAAQYMEGVNWYQVW